MKTTPGWILVFCAVFQVSCDSPKDGAEEAPESEQAAQAVPSDKKSPVNPNPATLLDQWKEKVSRPTLDRKERYQLLGEFGGDAEIPLRELVPFVVANFPEGDQIMILQQRIKKESKQDILECLRIYPLLGNSNFAESVSDRSFGLIAGEEAPLEGIAWGETIDDEGRRRSAAYGLYVSLPKFSKTASYGEATEVLERALKSPLFPPVHKESLAIYFSRNLKDRNLLKEDLLTKLEDFFDDESWKKVRRNIEGK